MKRDRVTDHREGTFHPQVISTIKALESKHFHFSCVSSWEAKSMRKTHPPLLNCSICFSFVCIKKEVNAQREHRLSQSKHIAALGLITKEETLESQELKP